MRPLISEWTGGVFSWRPADMADWDEDDWAAWRRYSDDLREDFKEFGDPRDVAAYPDRDTIEHEMRDEIEKRKSCLED